MAKILKCKCEHKSQDEMYGKLNRVFNELGNNKYRCTVCGNEIKL